MRLEAFAPAKINLFLHVGPPGSDGLHPLSSLAVFADVGDVLGAEPAEAFDYEVEGPFAAGLGGETDFVVRALRALTDGALPSVRLRLFKALPPASGIGGGTADGAAALRAVGRLLGATDAEAERAAATLGADGPACLKAAPVLMAGAGERLTPVDGWPELHAVLANPGVPCPTAAVYRAYDELGAFGGTASPEPPGTRSAAEAAVWLAAHTRNDLQRAALRVQPAAGEALAALTAAPETRLARMSGSGATCVALVDDADAARRLAARLSDERPGWWVRGCRLGDMRRRAAPHAPGTGAQVDA